MKNFNSKVLLLVVIIVVPLFCLALAIGGIFVGFGLTSTITAADSNLTAPDMSPDQIETEIVSIATDYAATQDLDMARQRLAALNLPNAEQYISFMVDRYIQEGRGRDDLDTQNLFMLADALGASTESMIAALASPTPIPTATPSPTITPLPTDTPVPPTAPPTEAPTEPPTPEPTQESIAEEAEEGYGEAAPAPADTPAPPPPPTDPPEPTATPEPEKPAVDFIVAHAKMIPNPAYNSCPGNHQIFVTIVDAAGNPLDGVTVEDTGRAVPPHLSGEKGPGKLEYDLWNNGFSLEVTKKEDGAPAASEVTPKLSSWDEDIPNEWLVEANYCLDINDCLQRKSNNQLCRGHYSYDVTFQKTH